VRRSNVRCDGEAVVLDFVLFLAFLRLMAIEASDAIRGVFAHFKFVHDGKLLASVALGTFASGFDEFRARLLDIRPWAGTVDKKSSDDKSYCDSEGHKHTAKGHGTSRANAKGGTKAAVGT